MHQKITHTSRFAYATANVKTENNVCRNKTKDILKLGGRRSYRYTRWFKYDRD